MYEVGELVSKFLIRNGDFIREFDQMEQIRIQIWNARVQILVEIGQNHSGKQTWGNFGTSSFSSMEIHMFKTAHV